MEKLTKEIEKFKQNHPDVAKAMEIFQMSMEDYQRAYRFLNEPRTYTANSTTLIETDTE
jgi:hypothetical protein